MSNQHGMGAVTASTPEQERQVQGEMSLLRDTLLSVETTVNELKTRVMFVSRDEDPPTAPCEVEDNILVPIADEIRSHRKKAGLINSILMDIIERLEI